MAPATRRQENGCVLRYLVVCTQYTHASPSIFPHLCARRCCITPRSTARCRDRLCLSPPPSLARGWRERAQQASRRSGGAGDGGGGKLVTRDLDAHACSTLPRAVVCLSDECFWPWR